jgi:hypothetical protein
VVLRWLWGVEEWKGVVLWTKEKRAEGWMWVERSGEEKMYS